MEPYEQSELGRVGEGLSFLDNTQPLTAATRRQVAKSRCLSHWRGGGLVSVRETQHQSSPNLLGAFVASCETHHTALDCIISHTATKRAYLTLSSGRGYGAL
jgi:hypothetical protein